MSNKPRRDAQSPREPLAGVDRAGAQLALLCPAGLEQLAAVDARRQRLVEHQHAVEAQHVRQEVVGEDGQLVDVVEGRDAREHEVVGRDLGALEEAGVVEERHALGQLGGEARGGAIGGRDQLQRVAPGGEGAQLRQPLGVERHQRMRGVLVQDGRHARQRSPLPAPAPTTRRHRARARTPSAARSSRRSSRGAASETSPSRS